MGVNVQNVYNSRVFIKNIGLVEIEEKSKSKYLFSIISFRIQSWGIDWQFFYITTDNAANYLAITKF